MLVTDGIVGEGPNAAVYLFLVVSIELVVEFLEFVFIHLLEIDHYLTDDLILFLFAQIIAQCSFPYTSSRTVLPGPDINGLEWGSGIALVGVGPRQ